MRVLITGAVVLLLAAVGCNNNGTPGGPGVNDGNNKPVVGNANETFTLSVPTLNTTIKQGDTKTVAVGIKRGTNFGEDVTIKVSQVPKGVTVMPAAPMIKHGDTETNLQIQAAEDAAVGSFTIKLTGHPSKGPDATNELKIAIEKK